MADNRMREDVESAYLDITEFTGQSLTGPRDLITRRILCSNPQRTQTEADAVNVAGGGAGGAAVRAASSNLQQLTFRILSTSPGAMLNAKVELVLPLIFHHAVSSNNGAVAGIANYHAAANGESGWTTVGLAGQIAPRRNGILKACRSISSTVNSTVSFTTRPSENIAVMEQMFTQPGVAGQTGVYSSEEASAWGNTDGQYGVLPADVIGGQPGLVRVRNLYDPSDGNAASGGCTVVANKGFIERRADFRSGGGAQFDDGTMGGCNNFLRTASVGGRFNYVKYDYRTTLLIPPFKTFNKDIYCRSPTWIPYLDSCDLMLNFKDVAGIKGALLQCASVGEGRNANRLTDYDFGFYAQPYVTVEWCVPPVQLRPSYTLPCWRTQHYSQTINWLVNTDDKKPCVFQGIRLDAIPSLISIHVSDVAGQQAMSNGASTTNWTEYLGTISDLAVTINEKLSILSDKDNYDLYKLYRMYAPDSKMSYTVWRELRQVVLIRSDVLALEKGQAVFSPTNLTVSCKIKKALHRAASAAVESQEIHMNFYYFNDALTLSQQAAAVTSMLLSPSDVQQLRVSPEAKEIQTLMQMGLQT